MNRRNFINDSLKAIAAFAVAPLALLIGKDKEPIKEDANVWIKTIELPDETGAPHTIWTPFKTYTCHFKYEYVPIIENGVLKHKHNYKKIGDKRGNFQRSSINIKRLIRHNKP